MVPSYEAVRQCVTYTGKRDSGVDASFFPLNSQWGFKYYRDENRGLALYMRQKWAAKHFLGPMLGDFTSFEYRGTKFFGFVTQILQTPKNEEACPVYKKFQSIVGRGAWAVPKTHKIVSDLINLGFDNSNCDNFDLHWANVGFDEVDSLMPIDFGWGQERSTAIDDTDICAILKKHNITKEEFIRA